MANDMLMAQVAAMGWLEWALLIFLSLPPLLIIFSKRVAGGRKTLWFILTSLFSWLAYVPFLIMTRKAEMPAGTTSERSDA